jgi:hypothetical protein
MGYLNLVGSFIYQEPLFRSKLDALAENDAQLKTDGWAQNTKTLFFQPTVPTGWTQDTSQNDKALRVVGSTGGGLSGGSQALSATIVLGHTHAFATPDDGAHTHTLSDHTHNGGTGPTTTRPTTNVMATVGGFLYLYSEGQGSANITELSPILASPGNLVLSTQGTHNHGTPGSSLSDIVFAYCDTIIGTKNAPSGTYTDLTNFWHTGDKIDFDPFTSYADNDAYTVANLMPATSIMIFGQASAPIGWTKLATLNDRMLRVVSGATGGATGGFQPVSSGASLAHTHVVAAVADHTHSFPDHTHTFGNADSVSNCLAADSHYGYIQDSVIGGGFLAACQQTLGLPTSNVTCYKSSTTNGGGGNTTAAGGHTHSLPSALADFILAYVDVIQCSKDSAGSPYTYTDYTSEFAWKKLVTYQRLNTLAKNDEYIHFHTTPFASQAFFFMPSPPTGWVKITTQHDKCLRMVSGGSGGSAGGGAQLTSATISLAHTHSIVAQDDHTHLANHTHTLGSGTQNIVEAGTSAVSGSVSGSRRICQSNTGVGFTQSGNYLINSTSQNPNETPTAAGNHSHGGTTDSQLTDIVLAYADVIWCTKS